MSRLDWLILGASLAFIVLVGLWKGRQRKDSEAYMLSNRDMRWYTICLSIMATQASAITFLSTPGQAYADGMRFVQFYLGLPLAMVVLSVTAVPIFHRLKVYTAYEYLEGRFDLKTRTLAATLFLIQRGLAVGLTVYAPALVLSVLLGWNIHFDIILVGTLVMIYTVTGGTKAVSWAQSYQMLIITTGMVVAGVMVIRQLPPHVSFGDALHVAGGLGRLNAIDTTFDLTNRYNLWSGLIGGFFLALSYFGTDQSQVQRYLTGSSVAQSRLGLLANGLFKVPMQFLILLLGAMVFVFYQFTAPPVFFNPSAVKLAKAGPDAAVYLQAEAAFAAASQDRIQRVQDYVAARHAGDPGREAAAKAAMQAAEAKAASIRAEAVAVVRKADPSTRGNDTNYVFLSYVLKSLPPGLIGLVLAAVFAASMSSMSAEINALGTTTVVDIWRRLLGHTDPKKEVWVSRLATLAWGCFALLFAEYASRLGSLVEAVNILGSLFYGTILGIFLVAFYVKRVKGGAAFYAALVAEAAVLCCFFFTKLSFLWYNVVGCLVVVVFSLIFNAILPRVPDAAPASPDLPSASPQA
ncbi:MAG: sodium:solute symporter [Holophagaceae bacterium]|nr:sodium:solute symporter [Holophagaceae bacterium]